MSKKNRNRAAVVSGGENLAKIDGPGNQPGKRIEVQTIIVDAIDTNAQDREIECMAESGYEYVECYSLPGMRMGLRFIRDVKNG